MKRLWLAAAVVVAVVFVATGCGGSSYADLEAARQAGRAEALAEQLEVMRERERERASADDRDDPPSGQTGGRNSRERTATTSPHDPLADADASFEAAKAAGAAYEQTGCYDDDLRASDWLLICGALRSELNRALADAYEQMAVVATGEGCHDLARWLRDAVAIYRADAADLDLARATSHDIATQRNALEAYTSRELPDYDEFDRLSTRCFDGTSDDPRA